MLFSMTNNSTTHNELLNTRQAAELLNVSEISIRRWTNSGKLPCLRVGARRERRFNQYDLMNFLEKQSEPTKYIDNTHNKAPDKRQINRSEVLLEGMSIEYGNHLCTVYETDIGIIKLSVPFLADGLKSGDKCFLIASGTRQAIILKHLSMVYSNTHKAIEDGRLIIFEGLTHGKNLYNYFEESFLSSMQNGDHHIRVLGDMAWAVEKDMNIDELMSFEMSYNNTLCKKFPVVSLCQYDARKFSGTEILNVLKNHDDTFSFPLSRFIGY